MLGKIGGLARALALVLAIVAGFWTIPGLNVALVLVVLGLIAGLIYGDDSAIRLYLTVLVLPMVGAALGTIPMIGTNLSAIAGNLALSAAGMAATVIALRLFGLVKGDVTGLTK